MNTPADSPNGARRHAGLKSLLLITLVVLNAALGMSLMGRMVAPNTAHAEAAVQGRASEFLIIPSRPLGMDRDVLYILDTDSARLGVAGFDTTTGRMAFRGPIDLRNRP